MYLKYIKQNATRNGVEIISYCMMDNHAHFLLFCSQIENVSKMMAQTNTSFALYYTNKRKNVGHVFRERYRSESIYTRSHFINCIKYIHNNPVKAHICFEPREYDYSSYNSFSNMSDYMKCICDLTDEDIKDIMDNSYTITRFLDDEYSKDDMEEAFKQLSEKYCFNKRNIESIAKLYKELKEVCKTTDKQIADLMGIHRATLLFKLKQCGVKK